VVAGDHRWQPAGAAECGWGSPVGDTITMIFPEESLVCCRVSPQTRGFDQEQGGNTAGLFEASARRGSKHEEMHADASS